MSKNSEQKSAGRSKAGPLNASLDEPLNVDAPPTIYGTKLAPETASAALNLAAEHVKQQQSLSNKYMIKHPITGFIISVAAAVFLSTKIVIPKNVGSASAFSYLYQLVLFNLYQIGSTIIVVALVFSCVFTIYSRINDLFFRTKLTEVTKENGEAVFGLNLADLAAKDKKAVSSKLTDNTYIVVYREAPIALISINEDKSLTSKECLVMDISTISCRRVYLKSGIIEDLIDWAMLRTKTISKEKGYGKSMKLVLPIYSFETDTKAILKSKGFTQITTAALDESRALGFLGVKRELWGVQFHFEDQKDA